MEITNLEGFIDVLTPGSAEPLAGKLSTSRYDNKTHLEIVDTRTSEVELLHKAIISGEIKNITFNSNRMLVRDPNEAIVLGALLDAQSISELRISQEQILNAKGSIESWYDADKREYVFRRVDE